MVAAAAEVDGVVGDEVALHTTHPWLPFAIVRVSRCLVCDDSGSLFGSAKPHMDLILRPADPKMLRL